MRLHYGICKSYNADFDGDEMNAHFPQNEVRKLILLFFIINYHIITSFVINVGGKKRSLQHSQRMQAVPGPQRWDSSPGAHPRSHHLWYYTGHCRTLSILCIQFYSSGVKMTIRGRFFTREEYQQHVYGALVDFPGRIKTLRPAILKPEPLWSGKQIISTIILNLVPEVRAT